MDKETKEVIINKLKTAARHHIDRGSLVDDVENFINSLLENDPALERVYLQASQGNLPETDTWEDREARRRLTNPETDNEIAKRLELLIGMIEGHAPRKAIHEFAKDWLDSREE